MANPNQPYQIQPTPVGVYNVSAYPKKKHYAAKIIIAIVAILVVVGIILLIVFLVRRARNKKKNETSNNNNSSDTGGSTDPGIAAPAGGCSKNADCSGSTPVCSATLKQCVQCDGTLGCGGTATCSKNTCCSATPPKITSVTTDVSKDSSFTVGYTYHQKSPDSPSTAGAQVEVAVHTPCGVLLGKVLRLATGSVTVSESELNLPNKHLFPGTKYLLRIRIKYNCGGTVGLFTEQTEPKKFNMEICDEAAVPKSQGTDNAGGKAVYSGFSGMAVRLLDYDSVFIIGAVISKDPDVHPNLAEIYYAGTFTQNLQTQANPSDPNKFPQWAAIPYPGSVGSTNYIRIFRHGERCNSALSESYVFFRGY